MAGIDGERDWVGMYPPAKIGINGPARLQVGWWRQQRKKAKATRVYEPDVRATALAATI